MTLGRVLRTYGLSKGGSYGKTLEQYETRQSSSTTEAGLHNDHRQAGRHASRLSRQLKTGPVLRPFDRTLSPASYPNTSSPTRSLETLPRFTSGWALGKIGGEKICEQKLSISTTVHTVATILYIYILAKPWAVST